MLRTKVILNALKKSLNNQNIDTVLKTLRTKATLNAMKKSLTNQSTDLYGVGDVAVPMLAVAACHTKHSTCVCEAGLTLRTAGCTC